VLTPLSGSQKKKGRNDSPEAIGRYCRALLRATDQATLATIEHAAVQQPCASLVMIAGRHDSMPILLLSELAEHTQHIKKTGGFRS